MRDISLHYISACTSRAGGTDPDMLILDSHHSYDVLSAELQLYEPMLRPGGYLLLHDSLCYAGVAAVVEQLYRDGRFDVITFDTYRRSGLRAYPTSARHTTMA